MKVSDREKHSIGKTNKSERRSDRKGRSSAFGWRLPCLFEQSCFIGQTISLSKLSLATILSHVLSCRFLHMILHVLSCTFLLVSYCSSYQARGVHAAQSDEQTISEFYWLKVFAVCSRRCSSGCAPVFGKIQLC